MDSRTPLQPSDHFLPEFPYNKSELVDESGCKGIRADLKFCLLQSDCCRVEKLTPRECLNQGKAPNSCAALAHTFGLCKRSMIDNRARMRGRTAI